MLQNDGLAYYCGSWGTAPSYSLNIPPALNASICQVIILAQIVFTEWRVIVPKVSWSVWLVLNEV